ncbi:hypothetical protein PCANC_04364 [Puccinia coronata f. sp. avenae]|uniref:Uncharacterized protein n=1 Tax=Puccinia coronata f. sp. avenae TaxID=200324 RepID=A0A2N5T997_9BASI|nr:hypothetical protein PCANC_04364 [Puccinia coronata f. sp. avenae]
MANAPAEDRRERNQVSPASGLGGTSAFASQPQMAGTSDSPVRPGVGNNQRIDLEHIALVTMFFEYPSQDSPKFQPSAVFNHHVTFISSRVLHQFSQKPITSKILHLPPRGSFTKSKIVHLSNLNIRSTSSKFFILSKMSSNSAQSTYFSFPSYESHFVSEIAKPILVTSSLSPKALEPMVDIAAEAQPIGIIQQDWYREAEVELIFYLRGTIHGSFPAKAASVYSESSSSASSFSSASRFSIKSIKSCSSSSSSSSSNTTSSSSSSSTTTTTSSSSSNSSSSIIISSGSSSNKNQFFLVAIVIKPNFDQNL